MKPRDIEKDRIRGVRSHGLAPHMLIWSQSVRRESECCRRKTLFLFFAETRHRCSVLLHSSGPRCS